MAEHGWAAASAAPGLRSPVLGPQHLVLPQPCFIAAGLGPPPL